MKVRTKASLVGCLDFLFGHIIIHILFLGAKTYDIIVGADLMSRDVMVVICLIPSKIREHG
jgi:hypothetical protein